MRLERRLGYAAGHIAGALNASLADLDRKLPLLAADAEIVAHCRGPYCIYAHQTVAAVWRRVAECRADGLSVAFSKAS